MLKKSFWLYELTVPGYIINMKWTDEVHDIVTYMHYAIVWCTSANQKQLFLPTKSSSFQASNLIKLHACCIQLNFLMQLFLFTCLNGIIALGLKIQEF